MQAARRRAAWSIAKLLLCALIGGVLIAFAAYPGLFAFGRAAGLAGDPATLPADLVTPSWQQTSYVYAADGKTLITSFYDQNRRDVPLSAVAPVMQQAVVAAEDVRFFQHGGVDLKAIVRALVADSGSGDTQGASTLTMQYVRNVLKNDPKLTPQQRADATAETITRKLAEARYAMALEQVLTKQQILERYLNIAYFGDGAYGVYAAAQTYFSTTPAKLTLPQATMLAGIIQSPDADNPVTGHADRAKARRAYVLNAMAGMGVITPKQATSVAAMPIKVNPRTPPNDCTAVPKQHNSWGFFCDYFVQWWDSQPAFGLTVAQRETSLKEGGWRIVTSLDPNVQAAATEQSLSVYGYDNRKVLPIAVVVPGTGRVLALAVNRHYSLAKNPRGRSYPNTVAQLVAGGGGIRGYPAGSTFKMFTMLAALEQGLTLDTQFTAPAKLHTQFPDGGPGNCGGFWCPVNANPSFMDGPRTMWTGFGRSVNTYFVWLEQQVGPQKAVAMAQRLGIRFRAPSDAAQARNDAAGWGSFTLGVADTTPLDLANAYATVASGGTYCKPLPVLSIKNSAGQSQAVASPQCQRVLSSNVAAAATDAARCPVGGQGYFGRCDGGTAPMVSGIVSGRPVAGKTGSSDQNTTETFVGFTPQAVAAGIAADPADPNDHVGSAVSRSVDIAVAGTLQAAVGDLPVVQFTRPSTLIAYGPDGPPPPPKPQPQPQPSPGGGGQGNPGPPPGGHHHHH